jgi:hypothetical protein
MATYYFIGGEDIDFQSSVGTYPITVDTGAGHFVSGRARCCVYPTNAPSSMGSQPFTTGVTSFWVGAQVYLSGSLTSNQMLAVTNTVGSNIPDGLYWGVDSNGYLEIIKTVSGSNTVLQTTTYTMPTGLHKLDMQVLNYGASGTITMYVDGVQRATYTGNISITGLSSFQYVITRMTGGGVYWALSEVIVSDVSTLGQVVWTNAATALGTTAQWTGAYTQVNEVTLSDANPIYTNTVGQDEQFVGGTPPSGYSPKCVRIAARAEKIATSNVGTLKLGIYNGSTVNVDAGHTLGTSFALFTRDMPTNPITGQQWGSEVSTVQADLESAT